MRYGEQEGDGEWLREMGKPCYETAAQTKTGIGCATAGT